MTLHAGARRRIAIVGAGASASRVVEAVRELEGEQPIGRRTIAVFDPPEGGAAFVHEADEAVAIAEAGAATAPVARRLAALEAALVSARAEAVVAGAGAGCGLADLAEVARRVGAVFVGPSAGALRLVGDAIAVRRLAERSGVAVAPWSDGPVEALADARVQAERLGWPVRLVATRADGAADVRRVARAGDLPAAFESARAAAWGGGRVFLEGEVAGARRIEVEAAVDRHGGCWVTGLREATLRWNHRPVLVEMPPAIDPEIAREASAATVRLLAAMGYENFATVVFLYQPGSRALALDDVRPGLDDAHPATEVATGLDLVKLQLRIADGERLVGSPPPVRGHALSVRLAAEDPEGGFTPVAGRVERLRIPGGPGIRVDAAAVEGDAARGPDTGLAQITSVGATRAEALARLRRALHGAEVVISGGGSTKAFLVGILDRPEVAGGACDTGLLPRLAARDELFARRHAEVALVVAAVEAHEAARVVDEARFFAGAVRGRPILHDGVGHAVELMHRGRRHVLAARALAPGRYEIAADGSRLEVEVERSDRFARRVRVAGVGHRVTAAPDPLGFRIEVDGVPHLVGRADAGIVQAGAPGIVVAVLVEEGAAVQAGDRLVVLEAMKMETAVVAPVAGRIRRVRTAPNVQVGIGTPLLEIEPPAESDVESPSAEDLDFARLAAPRACTRDEALANLRGLVLGWDVEPAAVEPLLAGDESRLDGTAGAEDLELEILTAYADVAALRRPRRADIDDPDPAPEESWRAYLRAVEAGVRLLPERFATALGRALGHYGVRSFAPVPALRAALVRIARAHRREAAALRGVQALLDRRFAAAGAASPAAAHVLDRLVELTEGRETAFAELVRQVRHRVVDEPRYAAVCDRVYAGVETALARLARASVGEPARAALVRELVDCPQPLAGLFLARFGAASPALRAAMLEVLLRRYYRIRPLGRVELLDEGECVGVVGEYPFDGRRVSVLMVYTEAGDLAAALRMLATLAARIPADHDVVADVLVWRLGPLAPDDAAAAELAARLDGAGFARPLRRAVFAIAGPESGHAIVGMQHFTFRPSDGGYREERVSRHLHPMMGKRLQLWRLARFDVERLPSPADVYLLRGAARENPKDERLFAFAEVRDATVVRTPDGAFVGVPELERMLRHALAAIRDAQAHRTPERRLYWNRVLLYVWPPLALAPAELQAFARRLAPATDGLGLEKVVVRARMPAATGGPELADTVVHLASPAGRGLQVRYAPPAEAPIRPLSAYGQKVVRMRQRHLVYPYEVVRMMTPGRVEVDADFPPGEFVEHDLDARGALVPVDRSPGENAANIVVGVIRNFTEAHPEGMTRVILLGDPSRAMGALAEPECRRINAALALARRLGVPLEWVAISAGAKISMESGTENMDWIALVLRRLIEFTQAGGEVNVLVVGINVGAQPYWNAEATMLMHTRGILVMVPEGAMVLTGKSALDYSGGVSAEDNQGIGGYDRTMGPNGQAQYWARDVADACRILFRHYAHCYVAPGERFPRRVATTDPRDRDVCGFAHGGPLGFATVGEVFSDAANPGRKRPFDIRRVMRAAADQDRAPLERWAAMRGAEVAVVWDAHLGGVPVCMLGVEAQPLPRLGFVPGDGPDQWTAGTLFPRASKKIARAINAASRNRPLVVLANLSGFDGSPESMRELQLEYGAEIGRAVVNFDGPIVFCVVSRYHGGAFVVFARTLNERLEAVALEGSYASVIGGAPAAAVVFAGEVDARTRADARVQALDAEIAAASGADRVRLRARREALVATVRSEKLGAVAAEFDRVHSVHRALEVGSLDRVIAPADLRPYLIDAIERGMQRTLAAAAKAGSGAP
ncbi:MAG: carbamoyl-phosphate synthase subunit L [Deltaproteobacteria bacterium]|nr:carbamoyl-phosphate synthase subunit L [Deltaproteobacteria bacterium]